MLNASKILLLLPDVAFAAELLPQKKPNTFGIQNCAQFNSDFFSNAVFVDEKVLKLFNKLEKDEPYQVILSDQHFINEIVTVKNENDAAIKEELKAKILPSLSISIDTHEVITTVLNEHKGETRIQITAIEKALIAPIRLAAEHSNIGIATICPLSWALKGLVSLEPSVTVAQLGSQLYVAMHYIGVWQCIQVKTEDVSKAVTIIRDFKKAEPSTMTVYALTNELIEQALKDGLKDVLPVQQMATSVTEEPSQLAIATTASLEYFARSLSIPDFPIPLIKPGKSTKAETEAYAKVVSSVMLTQEEEDESPSQGDHMPTAQTTKATDKKSEEKEVDVTPKVTTTEESDLPKPTNPAESASAEEISPKVAATAPTITTISGTAPQPEDQVPATKIADTVTTTATQANSSGTETNTTPAQTTIDLTQFAGGQSATSPEQLKPVQSKDGGKPMMKMILITLGIFIVTVAVGVGVGLLILRFSAKPSTSTPTVTVEPTPTEQPMPDANATNSAVASDSASASDSAVTSDVTKRTEKVLVVNATGRAGYAGTIRDKLVAGGFANSTAGNAKGTYAETGNFVYLKTEDATMIDDLEAASGLVLTEDETVGKTEDAAGAYDAVIVLNE